MGAWGVSLYQNDIADEIKFLYKDMLMDGMTNEEATKQVLSMWADALEDDDDAPIIWCALADIQWKLGRLLPEVKQQALEWIEKGGDLEIWYEQSNKLGEARKKVFEDLKNQLNSPQPPEKKIRKKTYYICPWKVGDVFAYKIESELAKENGLFGKYIIIQKCGDSFWEERNGKGNTYPVVRCWISCEAEFVHGLPCLRRAVPFKLKRHKYGFTIIANSVQSISKKLRFLGNYQENIPLDDDGNPENGSFEVYWKYFEETMIETYLEL